MVGERMRAAVYDRYGPPDVQRIDEVDRPVPAEDELLVRVHATSVTRTDAGLRSAELVISRLFTGIVRPRRRILGMEFSGTVAEIGSAVSQFTPGNEVFGIVPYGAHAEFLTLQEGAAVAHKPVGMSWVDAAGVCDGVSLARPCLEAAGLRAGQEVLIYGASGSVGTAGVQLARQIGARVTAVCGTTNVDLVKSLGAEEVIDYTRDDFTRRTARYDAIFDAVGQHSFRRSRPALKANGTYVDTDLGYLFHLPLLVLATRLAGRQKAKIGLARFRKEDVLFLKELLEAGTYRPVIDRTYPLDEVVEATRYVETGRKVGNVVITVN
jgi:NADPH:quinone reductase-like Zn-dependent oxidoreductase